MFKGFSYIAPIILSESSSNHLPSYNGDENVNVLTDVCFSPLDLFSISFTSYNFNKMFIIVFQLPGVKTKSFTEDFELLEVSIKKPFLTWVGSKFVIHKFFL